MRLIDPEGKGRKDGSERHKSGPAEDGGEAVSYVLCQVGVLLQGCWLSVFPDKEKPVLVLWQY